MLRELKVTANISSLSQKQEVSLFTRDFDRVRLHQTTWEKLSVHLQLPSKIISHRKNSAKL